ncbi:MAG: AAA family ATPase, partial [Dehalococcoidia bacterium]
MLLRHLTLENFRNIARLDLALPPGRTVLFGDNAQGKTNLLEAVSMFAAAKSVRADHERDLISWAALSEPIPFTRVAGAIERS